MHGVVHATTVVHRRGEEPYNLCLVDLDEGGRVMGRVKGLEPITADQYRAQLEAERKAL